MRIYQFLFFDPLGRSPALDFVECDDDGAATRSAVQQLGSHGTCRGVEIFEGDRLVARLERPVDRLISHGGSVHGTC